MKFGIVVFPGSNCDHDAYHVTKHVIGQEAHFLWHGDTDLAGSDCIILPGGFSYGDYLRCGALAKFSPVMREVAAFAARGGPVLGICNGFQVLLETGLLEGAMLRNASLRFVCKHVHLRVEETNTPFTRLIARGRVLRMPVAHMEGNYYADEETLKRIEAEGRVVFRYSTPDGQIDAASNPNGAARNIAGICNGARNVVGLMPHPERASEAALGSDDGRAMFDSVVAACAGGRLAESVA